VRLGLAEVPNGLAQVSQRLPAGGLDGGESVTGPAGLIVDDPGTGTGLDRNDPDRVAASRSRAICSRCSVTCCASP